MWYPLILKVASEKISSQPAKIKYICPIVRNFEHYYFLSNILPFWLFLLENNINLLVILSGWVNCYPMYSMKSKINVLLPFLISSRSSATASQMLLTNLFFCIFFPFICLLYSTGYCFIFSDNRPSKPNFKGSGVAKWSKKGTCK